MVLTQKDIDRILGNQSPVQRAFDANQPSISAQQPSSPSLNAISNVLNAIRQPLDMYGLNKNIPVVGGTTFADVTGLNQVAPLAQDVAYGRPVMRGGSLQTMQADPRLAGLVDFIPSVGVVAKAGQVGAKAGAREIARQIETGTGVFGKGAIDPRTYISPTDNLFHGSLGNIVGDLRSGKGTLGEGFYLTNTENQAALYPKLHAKLKGIENPNVVVTPMQTTAKNIYELNDLPAGGVDVNKLKDLGYDGISYKNELMIFDPKNVKVNKPKTTFEAAQETARRNAALPVSEGGLGLPATNTAMDRAKAMGYDTKGYTGSRDDIRIADVNKAKGKSSETGIWFTDSPDRANTYAGTMQGGNVTPALLNRGNIFNVEADARNWNRLGANTKVSAPKITVMDNEDVELLKELGINASPKQVTKKPINKTLKKMFPDEFLWDDYFTTDDLARFARREGYDSSQFNNVKDIGPYGLMVNKAATEPATNYVIYKPENVRSINAAFDPFRRNEPDILAGVAAAPVGLLAVDENKKKKTTKK